MNHENTYEKINDKKIYAKRVELLAPAGGVPQYIAAVENGADAIYLGGKSYNARMGAGNFSDRELEQAIDFGHKRGVRSYITMNTLLGDDELDGALEFARLVYRMGADGLIVQDLGLGERVRYALPDMPLHLSTQGSVYDRQGVMAVASLGYSRVVLARELSLAEIQEACRQDQAEIEVFVHGALCICYSGQCQLSRFIGGRSGNRGGCAQPCRLPYRFLDQDGRLLKGPGGSAGQSQPRADQTFPLSPKDLCLVEQLGDLVEAGVASFKIEGRMKSPEYVAVVTAIYRKYLDQYLAQGSYTVSREDWLMLNQIFNRGGFTKGYFYQDPGKSLMCPGLPKHQGVPVGKVVRQIEGGSHIRQQGAHLVDIRMDRNSSMLSPLTLGDGVEIHSRQVTGNVVTYLKEQKDGTLRIGDIKGQVEPGDRVYRITDRDLMEQARKSYENLTFEEGKYQRKNPIHAIFRCGAGMPMELEVLSPLAFMVCDSETLGQQPVKRETSPEDIKKQLSKTGGTPYEMAEIEIEMTEPVTIPLSAINALRRRALALLDEKLTAAYKRDLPTAGPDAMLEEKPGAGTEGEPGAGLEGEPGPGLEAESGAGPAAGREGVPDAAPAAELQYFLHDFKDLKQVDSLRGDQLAEAAGRRELQGALSGVRAEALPVTALVDVRSYMTHQQEIQEFEEESGILVCPYIPAINRGGDEWIEGRLDELVELVGAPGPEGRARRVHVGNIRWIRPLAERGVRVFGEPGLNIGNEEAGRAYGRLGLTDSMDSLEVIDGSGALGWLPLMVTEHEMTPGTLIDRKGLKLRVMVSPDNHKTYILGKRDGDVKSGANVFLRSSETIRIYV